MKKISIITIIVEIFFCFYGYSQKPTLEWMASFHNQYSTSLDVDKFNNIFISGTYLEDNGSNYRSKFLTIKYNSSGILQWYRLYSGQFSIGGYADIAYKNIADGAGNVYVAGMSVGNSGYDDVFIIKYNAEGDTIWTARYNRSNSDDYFSDMVKDKFDNIYIACTSALYTSFDYTTIKYDSSGHKLWEAFYNNFGSSADFATAIAIDSSQNVYVTGYCTNQYILYEYVTVKYDRSGVQQWAAKYTSYYNDAQPNSIAVDKTNNVYVTGYIDYPVPKRWEFLTVKYDSSGSEVWTREFGRLYLDDAPNKIHIDSSGSILLNGSSIVKYNSNGVLQWADTLGRGYGALDKANNFYVTTLGNDTIHYGWIQTTKYKPDGSKNWTIWYNTGYNFPLPREILVDINNNFYIRVNTIDSNDILLLKYSQLIGISGNSSEIPDKFELYQNYPNPFNPATTIRFSIPPYKGGKGDVSLKVFDILGREILVLVNEKLMPGIFEVKWNASNFSSGVYFYSLIVNGTKINTRKMVLIK